MPDLLGATNPVPGYDNTITNRNIPISPDNNQVQNVPDPSRVTGCLLYTSDAADDNVRV